MNSSLLLLRLSALGDILHTLPAAEALRAAHPSRRIGWVVEQPYGELVRTIAPVDEVFTVATKRWRRNLLSSETRNDIFTARRALLQFGRGGTSVDFQGLVKSAFLGWAAGSAERYGFDRQAIREKAALPFINRRVSIDRDQHVIEWNLQLAEALGARRDVVATPKLTALSSDPSGALRPLIDEHRIMLNPGAGNARKQWPVSSFIELAAQLEAAYGTRPLVLWGPGEKAMADAIVAGGHAVAAPSTNLSELAFLLQHATLLIASDTGPLHLAAAFGTRVVGLFGPTDPKRNGPWGQLQYCVNHFVTDRQMSGISAGEVMQRVRERIQ